MPSFEREPYCLNANSSARADDQNRTHLKLLLVVSLLKIALGMPLVAAFIQPAHIRYQGLGVPDLDFEGGNKCVFGLYDEMAGVAEVLEPNLNCTCAFPLPLQLRFWCGASLRPPCSP